VSETSADELTLDDYLRVPYRLLVESFEGPDGDWHRRASYPELPGCFVEGDEVVRIIDEVDALRVRMITRMVADGERVPVPRPPLRTGPTVREQRRLEFARYLVETGRLSEDGLPEKGA
jgi:hypothetical protein